MEIRSCSTAIKALRCGTCGVKMESQATRLVKWRTCCERGFSPADGWNRYSPSRCVVTRSTWPKLGCLRAAVSEEQPPIWETNDQGRGATNHRETYDQ